MLPEIEQVSLLCQLKLNRVIGFLLKEAKQHVYTNTVKKNCKHMKINTDT